MTELKQSAKPLTWREQIAIWEALQKEDDEIEEKTLLERQAEFNKIIKECREEEEEAQ